MGLCIIMLKHEVMCWMNGTAIGFRISVHSNNHQKIAPVFVVLSQWGTLFTILTLTNCSLTLCHICCPPSSWYSKTQDSSVTGPALSVFSATFSNIICSNFLLGLGLGLLQYEK